MDAGCHEAGDVSHVNEQQRTHTVGDRGHPLEVEDAWVGGGTGNHHLRADLLGDGLEGVVVDSPGCLCRRRTDAPRTGARKN